MKTLCIVLTLVGIATTRIALYGMKYHSTPNVTRIYKTPGPVIKPQVARWYI